MNQELALVGIKGDDEATRWRLDNVAAERNGLTAQANDLCSDIGDLKRDQSTANGSAMICVRRCNGKRAVAQIIFEPVGANRMSRH